MESFIIVAWLVYVQDAELRCHQVETKMKTRDDEYIWLSWLCNEDKIWLVVKYNVISKSCFRKAYSTDSHTKEMYL